MMAVGVTRHGRYWGPCARLMVGTGDGVDAAALSASGSSLLLRLKMMPPVRMGKTGSGLTWMLGSAAGAVAVRVSPEGDQFICGGGAGGGVRCSFLRFLEKVLLLVEAATG